MKTCTLLLLIMVAACDADEDPAVAPTESEIGAAACADLEAAHLAMCQRCGITPPLPASSPSSDWKYAECSKVKRVRDTVALYDVCIPALKTGCYAGDTPEAIGCHQLEF